jgi:hypothetical protein
LLILPVEDKKYAFNYILPDHIDPAIEVVAGPEMRCTIFNTCYSVRGIHIFPPGIGSAGDNNRFIVNTKKTSVSAFYLWTDASLASVGSSASYSSRKMRNVENITV